MPGGPGAWRLGPGVVDARVAPTCGCGVQCNQGGTETCYTPPSLWCQNSAFYLHLTRKNPAGSMFEMNRLIFMTED